LVGETKAKLLRERKRYIHTKVWDDEDDPPTDD